MAALCAFGSLYRGDPFVLPGMLGLLLLTVGFALGPYVFCVCVKDGIAQWHSPIEDNAFTSGLSSNMNVTQTKDDMTRCYVGDRSRVACA